MKRQKISRGLVFSREAIKNSSHFAAISGDSKFQSTRRTSWTRTTKSEFKSWCQALTPAIARCIMNHHQQWLLRASVRVEIGQQSSKTLWTFFALREDINKSQKISLKTTAFPLLKISFEVAVFDGWCWIMVGEKAEWTLLFFDGWKINLICFWNVYWSSCCVKKPTFSEN